MAHARLSRIAFPRNGMLFPKTAAPISAAAALIDFIDNIIVGLSLTSSNCRP
jgi:hypothetical protein